MKFTRAIKDALTEEEPAKTVEFLHSGCHLLNLAGSQRAIDGGWARGRIINFVGDGSSGKCEKNSYILTEYGMIKIDNIPSIQNIEPHSIEIAKGISVVFREKQIKREPHSIEIAGYENKTVKASHFYCEKVSKTIHIKAKGGYEKEGTYDHPVMVWIPSKQEFEMKKLSLVQQGDYLVIQKGMQFFPKTPYSFTQEEMDIQRNESKRMTGIKRWTPPQQMTDELAAILGYLIADGNILKQSVCISNSKAIFNEDIIRCLDKMDIFIKAKKRGVVISRINFRDFIFNLVGKPQKFTASFKTIPKCILQSNKKHQAIFLRALIDCDGYFSKGFNLEYYTSSLEMAKQVQMILLNFGIFSMLHKKWNKKYQRNYFNVRIGSDDIEKYAFEIGSLKYNFSNMNIEKSIFGTIPGIMPKIWKDIEEIRSSVNWSKNGRIKGSKTMFPHYKNTYRKGNCTHREIKKFISLFKSYRDMSFYKELLNYHFVPVTNIIRKNEETFVYDFMVPEDHMFWSGGMISHNTLLSLETCAHAYHNLSKKESSLFPPVENLRIVYNNIEGVMDLPIEQMYGKAFVNSVEWIQTPTCEGVGRDFMRRAKNHKKGDCLIYVVDSLDATMSEKQKQRIDKSIKDDAEIEGSFGVEKAKYFSSAFFSSLCELMKDKDITLICISQVREKIGVMFGERYCRTGGKALDFYTHQVVWLAEKEKMYKTYKGHKVPYGVKILANFKRSKVSKPFRKCEFQILFNHGIDDIESMLDYVYGNTEKKIKWKDKEYQRSELIKYLEENEKEYNDLIQETENLWFDIEDHITPKRRRKFE